MRSTDVRDAASAKASAARARADLVVQTWERRARDSVKTWERAPNPFQKYKVAA